MNTKEKKDKAEDRRLKKAYGVDLSYRNKLEKDQKNKCWVCGRPPKRLKLALDHNHKTNVVRGLLCMTCNRKIIGLIEKYKIPVKRIVEYFQKFDPSNIVLKGRSEIR